MMVAIEAGARADCDTFDVYASFHQFLMFLLLSFRFISVLLWLTEASASACAH